MLLSWPHAFDFPVCLIHWECVQNTPPRFEFLLETIRSLLRVHDRAVFSVKFQIQHWQQFCPWISVLTWYLTQLYYFSRSEVFRLVRLRRNSRRVTTNWTKLKDYKKRTLQNPDRSTKPKYFFRSSQQNCILLGHFPR